MKFPKVKSPSNYTVIDITDRMWEDVPSEYQQLVKVMGEDKINALLIKENIEDHTYIDENGQEIPFKLDVKFQSWITGRGIGKTWWPIVMALYKTIMLKKTYNAGWLNKQIGDIPSSVQQGMKVLGDLSLEYNINWYDYVSTNTSMTGGFLRMYDRDVEQMKKLQGGIYQSNAIMFDSFETIDRLAKRNPTKGHNEDVFADEIVSHNQRELPPDAREWNDKKKSIKASWLKYATDNGLANCFYTFANRWDEKHPDINEAEEIIPYADVRPWFLEDLANNHIKFFYVVELKKIIVYATKFNALRIRINDALVDQLLEAAKLAIEEDDKYQLAAILGEAYEGADTNEYTYRHSMPHPDKFKYGVVEGAKEALYVSIDLDPNVEFVVSIGNKVMVGAVSHSNTYDTVYLPCDFKGRSPLPQERDALIEQIIDAIWIVQAENGLPIQQIFVDDNTGFFITEMMEALPNVFISKPIEKKDDFNILTRQSYFQNFIRTRLHFADTAGNRRLIEEFWNCKNSLTTPNKRDEGAGVNMLNGINAWEYKEVYTQYSFYDENYQPIKQFID